jgi:DNA-3-methyladenine glycosylase
VPRKKDPPSVPAQESLHPNRWKPLPRSFYARPTLEVARDLLGAVLVRHLDGHLLAGRIVEAEAYVGEEDPACHASHGLTPRTEVMYGPPGYSYVYFTYGMHYMLNVVTEPKGFPAAVLIRGVEPLAGIEQMRRKRSCSSDLLLTNGPARICSAFEIDLRLNCSDLTRPPLLIAEPSERERDQTQTIQWTPRIGIRKGRSRHWRCFLQGNPYVSRGRPGVVPRRRLKR